MLYWLLVWHLQYGVEIQFTQLLTIFKIQMKWLITEAQIFMNQHQICCLFWRRSALSNYFLFLSGLFRRVCLFVYMSLSFVIWRRSLWSFEYNKKQVSELEVEKKFLFVWSCKKSRLKVHDRNGSYFVNSSMHMQGLGCTSP